MATENPPLPTRRAFLVQLSGDSGTGEAGITGRVEHVRSGEAARFASEGELVSFMRGVVEDEGGEGAEAGFGGAGLSRSRTTAGTAGMSPPAERRRPAGSAPRAVPGGTRA